MLSVIYLDSSFFEHLVGSADDTAAELDALTGGACGDSPDATSDGSVIDPLPPEQRAFVSTKLRQIETVRWWEQMRHKYTLVTAARVVPAGTAGDHSNDRRCRK